MGLNDLTNPRLGEMTLRVTNGPNAAEFPRFLEYDYRESWLDPSDSWSFTLASKELSPTDGALLVPGNFVQLVVDGHVQSRGVIDEVIANADTHSGNVVRVEGRDWHSNYVDAQVDPQQRFLPSMTLLDLVVGAYSSVAKAIDVAADNIANRNVITGFTAGEQSAHNQVVAAQQAVTKAQTQADSQDTPANRAILASKQAVLKQAQEAAFAQRQKLSAKKGRPSKSFVMHEEKPYPNEGLFTFVSRVCQRFGLWVRPWVDGQTIVVAAPDFDQAPRYGIHHALDATSNRNNAERAHFAKSRKDQPSIIYASGFGYGGDFAKSRLRAGIVNPVVNADNSKVISKYPDVRLVEVDPVVAAFAPITEQQPRPAFLYDPESHTQEQLESFLRRELSLRLRKALTARYEIMGHKLNGQPVAVDTIVSVLDQQQPNPWNGPLWVLGRQFRKDPKSGARTTLDLILPGSLQFS